MDLMLLRAFQQQVLLQCRFMLLAANDINLGLQQNDVNFVFYALQNLLNAGANISKACWGQGGRLSEQRRPLRETIGISDDSPLRKPTMRNHFEHIDERLDVWARESKRRWVVDLSIAARSDIGEVDRIDWFRAFDPVSTDLTFWGQDFNVQEMVDEVNRILPRLLTEANKPPWEEESEGL